jgi:hypothetical protein
VDAHQVQMDGDVMRAAPLALPDRSEVPLRPPCARARSPLTTSPLQTDCSSLSNLNNKEFP